MKSVEGTVGLVAPYPPPAGGMAVQAQRLSELLGADGWRVCVVPTNPTWPTALRGLRRVRGLRTVVTAAIFLWRLIGVAPRVDLLHILACSHLDYYLFTVPTVVIGRVWRVPVVVNFRGGNARLFFTRHPRALRWLHRAERVTVPSAFLRDVFADFQVATTIVPNIADVSRFEYRPRTTLVPHLVVTRHLEPWYNLTMAVRAFERVKARRPAATLTIAGDGSERPPLERLVAERGIDGVRFLGRVPNERMAAVYDECDVALNPSNVDNMPISVLEAFASGLVLVSTNVGGVPYIVDDGRTGFLVPADDSDAMADRILRLCDHPDEAAAATRAARGDCDAYTWPAVRRALLAVYRDVLKRGRGGGS